MIEFKDITLSYKNKEIFSAFSVQIRQGEKVLLDLPSGTGKTTFLKMIMGFVHPESGEVLINGMPITTENIRSLRNKIAYLPQELNFSNGEVEKLIQNVFSYHSNRSLIYDRSIVLSYFAELQMDSSILNSNTEQLSGGEKQRLGIVLMRLLKREIFLLDEVTSALNLELKTIIRDYFLSLEETIIVVSHDEIWRDANMKRLEW